MRKNKLVRTIGIAALVVLALGGIGYVAGNGEGDGNDATSLSATDGANEDAFRGSDVDLPGRPVASTGNIASPPNSAEIAPSRNAAQSDAGGGTAGSDSKGSIPGTAPAPDGVPGLQTSIDRKIVQTASVQLQVRDVGVSFEEVGRVATGAGGFVASSNFSYKGEQQFASMTIRVPVERYQTVLADLRDLGVKVDAESSDSEDATEEYTDLQSRLRTLEATEQQLLGLLARATTVTDILTVQDRLNNVNAQMEQVKGRMQLLDNLTSLATITVHLRPEASAIAKTGPDGRVDLGEKLSQAWDDSLDFLSEVAGGLITVIVFSWWLPLVAIPAVVLWRLLGRRPPAMRAVD
jgi:hypothetical protein